LNRLCFSFYTDFMNTDAEQLAIENNMTFEWDHLKDDEIMVQAFLIEMFIKSPFHKARISRHIKVSFLLVLAIAGWSYLSGGLSSLLSTILVMTILLPIGFVFVHLLSGPLSNTASFRAKAKGLVKFRKNLPLGKHRLIFSNGMLEWYSYSHDETFKCPARSIDRIQEQEGRMFFSRDHTHK